MAEPATLARPYAEALFKVAGSGDVVSASAQIDALAAVAADEQLRRFADSPQATSQQVFDLFTQVVGEPLSQPLQNFLRTVIENGRVTVLPEIAAQFHARVNDGAGSADALIYSAFAISPEQLAGILPSLERRFASRLNPTVVIDASLIGGTRVVVGDEVLDTSVKARLEQMKAALTA